MFVASEYIILKINKIFLIIKLRLFSYPLVLTFVLGAQKNRLIETTYVLVDK